MGFLEQLLLDLANQGILAGGAAAVRRLFKMKPSQEAISEVDFHYSQSGLEGVGLRLTAWLEVDAVVETLGGLNDGSPPSASTIRDLAERLNLEELHVGSTSRPSDLAAEILTKFFRCLYDKYLNGPEGTAIQTKHLDRRLDLIERFTGLGSTRSDSANVTGVGASDLPVDDAYNVVKEMLRVGKPAAALEWLAAKQKQLSDKPSTQAKYDLHSHRGLAFMQLERLAEAEEEFRRALALMPNRANANINVGQVLLMQGRYKEAKEYVDRAQDLDPTNEPLKKLKAQVLARTDSYESAIETARAIASDEERSQILGVLHLNAGKHSEAVLELRRALAHDPDDPDTNMFLAQAELAQFQGHLNALGIPPWGRKPADVDALLKDASIHLDHAIELFSRRDAAIRRGRALLSRAAIRAYHADPGALTDYKQAVESGAVAADATRAIAGFMLRIGNCQEALRVLEQHPPSERTSELIVMRAAALSSLGKYDEAIGYLESPETRELVATPERELTLIDVCLDAQNVDRAERELVGLTSHASSPDVMVRHARILLLRGQPEDALQELSRAIQQAPAGDKWNVKLIRANLLLQQRRWGEAHAELQDVVTVDAPPEFINKYLVALYNDRHWAECINFAQEVRRKRGVIPEVASVEARALTAVTRLQEADDILVLLEATGDRMAEWRIERADIAQQIGDGAKALALTPAPEEASSLSVHSAMRAAGIRALNGDYVGAIETAYHTRLANPNDPDAYRAYIGMFLRLDQDNPSMMQAEHVTPGTSVTLESDGRQREYEVIDGKEAREGQCSINSELGKCLRDRKVGESVTLVQDEFGADTWTIKNIRSKYVAVFQRSLVEYGTRFPGVGGLREFTLTKGDPQPILKNLDRVSDSIQQIRDLYQQYPLPVGSLAKLVGDNDVEMWYALISGVLGRFYAYAPQTAARAQMLELLQNAESIVLEVTTLCALAELHLLQHLPKLGKRYLISQETNALLNEVRSNLKPKAAAMLGKQEGRYVLTEFTEEQIQNQANFWEGVITWVKENARAESYDVPPGPENKTLTELYSGPVIGSMLVAKTHGAILATEDFRLRQIARNSHDIGGCGSIEFARLLAGANHISEEELQQSLVRTALWHYHFTSVTIEMLKWALRQDGQNAGIQFKGLLRTLQDPETSDASIIDVLCRLLYDLWTNRSVAVLSQQGIVFACLDTLAARPARQVSLRAFEVRLRFHFDLIPLHLKEISDIMRLWAKTKVY